MTTSRYIVEAILFFVPAGKLGSKSLSNSSSILQLEKNKPEIQSKDYNDSKAFSLNRFSILPLN